MEKLLPVTDKSALRLGVSVGQFLGEAESNIEFEQVFGWGYARRSEGLWKALYPCPLSGPSLGRRSGASCQHPEFLRSSCPCLTRFEFRDLFCNRVDSVDV